MNYTKEYTDGSGDYSKLFKYIKLIHCPLGNIIVQDPIYKKVLEILPSIAKKSDVILDYGCGIAYLTKKIRDRNYCIAGCDIVEPLIDKLNNMKLPIFNCNDKRLNETRFDLFFGLSIKYLFQ